MRRTRTWFVVAMLASVICPLHAQESWKALQFSTTLKDVWKVQRAEVSTSAIGTPQAVFSTSDVMSTFQAWGTCFNELDWYALQRLTPEAQAEYYERMFSPQGDLRFSLGRIPVGASDYAGPEDFYDPAVFHQRNEPINLAESWYSCDEMPVGETDFNMEHFTIERDKKHIIPFIKKAMEQNPDMTFWCSPWSPPQWMKKSHHYSNRAGYGNGLDTTYPSYTSTQFIMEPDYLNALVLYFSKFIDAYGEEGIPVTGLCYQNEAYTCNYYPNTSWEATSTAIFNADYLIPYMRVHHPGVKVWLGTMNTNHVDDVFEVILNYQSKSENPDFNGKKLSEMFDGIGFQWEGRGAIGTLRSRYPDLEFIQTESECGAGTFDWGAGAHTFELIHHYLNNGCVTYTNWNSILGGNGRGPFMNWNQNGLLHLDINKRVAYYTPEFYAYKHYSHFIGDGTKILRKTSNQPLVLAAQQPDGTIVVVVGNDSGGERALTFSVDDKYMNVRVPANSYNTFLIGKAEIIDEIAEKEGVTEPTEDVTDCTNLIQNPTFASTAGWTKENVGTVDASAIRVLEQQCYNSFSTNFTSMDVHQDIHGVPAGTYYLTCRSVCGEGLITDQHAYLIGYDDDPLTSDNRAESPVKTNDSWDALNWELQTTDCITVEEGQNLRIGYCSTSNGGQSGWFAVTDFCLYRLGKPEEVEPEAPSSEFEGSVPTSGEQYYLYNIGQHKFVNIGHGSYGTQMGLDDIGLEFTLESTGTDGQFVLKTASIADNTYYGWLNVAPNSSFPLPSGIDAQYYLNSTSSRETLSFSAVEVDDVTNAYVIQFPGNGSKFLAYDPAFPSIVWLTYDGTVPDAQWQLVTRSERLALLQEKGEGSATFMIDNPDFYHDYTGDWTDYVYQNGTLASHIENSAFEGLFRLIDKSPGTFDLSQTIDGLPAGNYLLTVDGYYSNGDDADHTTVNAYLYAGENAVPIQQMHNGATTTTVSDRERAYTIDGTTYYMPEWNTTEAPFVYFANGFYPNQLTFAYDASEPLRIGVRDDVGKYDKGTWVDLTHFRLHYLGSKDPTAIRPAVPSAAVDQPVFDLQGRSVSTSTPPAGIYISGHQKILVK